jgi:predicted PolB exonuclease-like 3'-5' exonuclease
LENHRTKFALPFGDDFPELIYHAIICIGALVATRTSNGWEVQAVGAPHVGQRPEKELIESFVNKIARLSPQLVSYNGCAFDLPVLRYRAMIHEVFAPGMHNRAYFHRYTDDNVDLCDVLSSFSFGAKVKLDELSRIMGLPANLMESMGRRSRHISTPVGFRKLLTTASRT